MIIGTGWHAKKNQHNRNITTKRIYDPNYLWDIWQPYILHFYKPDNFFVYVSNCEILPAIPKEKKAETVYSIRDINQHKHDDHAISMMQGAYYAHCMNQDFLYIEQDCMVYGLDRAIRWLEKEKPLISYGYGEYSYLPEWAENCFVFIRRDFVPEMIRRHHEYQFHNWHYYRGVPEVIFHRMFQDVATFWPFGFGRKQINWNEPIFYAQQLNDKKIDKFLEKIK